MRSLIFWGRGRRRLDDRSLQLYGGCVLRSSGMRGLGAADDGVYENVRDADFGGEAGR